MAWAFGTVGVRVSRLCDAISHESMARLKEFGPQDFSNVAWAFAALGHDAPALFNSMAEEASRHVDSFSAQNLANMAWAYAVFDMRAPQLFTRAFVARCAELSLGMVPGYLTQLWLFHLWCDFETSSASSPSLSPSLATLCRDAFFMTFPKPSSLQMEVGAALRSMGYQVEENVRDELTGYLVDLVVHLKSENLVLAIEVDGPVDFVAKYGSAKGEILLKRRLLTHSKLGHEQFRLVSIPYWDWNELVRNSENSFLRKQREVEFLSSRLGLVV